MLLALLLIAASLSAHRTAAEREAASEAQISTRAILSSSAALKVAALQSSRGERGYVVTGNRAFLKPFQLARPVIEAESAHLLLLTEGKPDDHAHVRMAANELEALAMWQARVIAQMDQGNRQAAIAMVSAGEGRRLIESVLRQLEQLDAHAAQSLEASTLRAENLSQANDIFQYGLAVVGLLLLMVSFLATRAMHRAATAEWIARKELERRAMTDDLTGLANRRELLASLERSIAAARRNRRPLALALIDIDHFKRINDCHGHPAGDAVIRRIAMLSVDVMRGQDTVGRLGGEEFAVVLPDCTASAAMAACERLREAVRSTDLELETGAQVYITLSTGVAVMERHDTAESMIARADAALYAAKDGGRDQVKLAA